MVTAALQKLAALEAPLARRGVYYGWVMVPAATLVLACSAPGQSFGVAVFKESFREDLGLSRSAVSGAYMLGTLIAAAPLTLVGGCIDRFGPRRTLAGIAALFALACLVVSQATGWITLFVGFLGLRLFGQGAMPLVSGNTMALWFNRRLGLVSGIMATGMAGAIALTPMLFVALLERFGWRATYALLGVAVAALLLAMAATVFRNRPEELGQRPDGDAAEPEEAEAGALEGHTLREAMRTRAYWITALNKGFWALANTAVIFCLVSVLQSRGMDESAARASTASALFVFGTTLAIAHLPTGYLADRLPLNRLLALGALSMAVAFGLFRLTDGGALLYPMAMFQGLAQALIVAVSGTIWRRYYGRAHLGKIKGSLTTVMVGASSVGPFLVDGTFELVGGYGPILTVLAAAPLPLAVAALFATPPGGKASAYVA